MLWAKFVSLGNILQTELSLQGGNMPFWLSSGYKYPKTINCNAPTRNGCVRGECHRGMRSLRGMPGLAMVGAALRVEPRVE